MTKNDIAIMVAKATGLQQNEVKQVVQLLLDGIVEILVQRERLELRGFGVIEVRHRRPRQGRNPMTGEKVPVPARKAIRFQAGKYMLERVNDEIEPGVPDADGSRQRLLKSLIASLAGHEDTPDEEETPKVSRRRKRAGTARRGRPPRYQLRGARIGQDTELADETDEIRAMGRAFAATDEADVSDIDIADRFAGGLSNAEGEKKSPSDTHVFPSVVAPHAVVAAAGEPAMEHKDKSATAVWPGPAGKAEALDTPPTPDETE